MNKSARITLVICILGIIAGILIIATGLYGLANETDFIAKNIILEILGITMLIIGVSGIASATGGDSDGEEKEKQ